MPTTQGYVRVSLRCASCGHDFSMHGPNGVCLRFVTQRLEEVVPTGMPPDKSPVNQITFDEYRSAVNRWAEQVALELKTQAEKIESLEKYLRGGGKTVLQNSKDPPDYSKWFNEDEDGLEVGYDGWPERRKF